MHKTLQAIRKKLQTTVARLRTPLLRRSTLVKVRYKMGLMLTKYRREHLNGRYDNCGKQEEVYNWMEGCMQDAMEILLKETKILEDDPSPKRLRQKIIPA